MHHELANLLKLLEDHGITAVCCGGAARDVLHGKVPKDWDIVILGEVTTVQMEAAVQGIGAGKYDLHEAYDDDEDNLFQGVVKFKWPGLGDVDLIKYRGVQKGVLDVIELFDCTLNQVWFENPPFGPLQIRMIEDYPSVVYDIPNHFLNSANRLPERFTKMAQAFPEYKHIK